MTRRAPIEDESFDAFGRDPRFIDRVGPALDRIIDRYFRVEVTGLEHVPDHGRAILVANHGGALPWDAVVLGRLFERSGPRPLRPLLEDALMTAPFLGTWLRRLGAVRASQENARRLLDREELVAVFPEGLLGLSKLYRYRYKLVRFGRGGFVRLALSSDAPILPVAVLGAEDASPLLAKVAFLFRGTHVDYLPVTPVVPLPAKWAVRIGEPIRASDHIAAPDDAIAVSALAAEVRERIQRDLDELAEGRLATYHAPWAG